jgi:hypothetical protein
MNIPKRFMLCLNLCFHSLGNAGDAFLKEFTTEFYAEFMPKWEKALNHSSKTSGKQNDFQAWKSNEKQF